MPDKERQDSGLPELVVKEAVGVGMDSPMRETIVEAVEEAEGGPSRARQLPLVGAALGIGAGIGYVLGSLREEPVKLASVAPAAEESEIVEEAIEAAEEVPEPSDDDESEDGGGGRLSRVVLLLAIAAGIALARRRMKSREADEWEPIEEFDTVSGDDEDESETEAEEEAGGETDEGEEAET